MHSYKVAIVLVLASLLSWSEAGLDGGYGGIDAHSYGLEGSYGGHDEYHPPNYSYEYSVHDPLTGDVKKAQETREGDSVTGYYAMKEADGSTREVHYTADSHSGFNAIVTKTGHDGQKVEVHGNQHHV